MTLLKKKSSSAQFCLLLSLVASLEGSCLPTAEPTFSELSECGSRWALQHQDFWPSISVKLNRSYKLPTLKYLCHFRFFFFFPLSSHPLTSFSWLSCLVLLESSLHIYRSQGNVLPMSAYPHQPLIFTETRSSACIYSIANRIKNQIESHLVATSIQLLQVWGA